MPRLVSLGFRAAANAEHTGEVPVALVTITHPDLDAPVRLSSDPTSRLSADPLRYGTRHRGDVYEFVLMAALLPDDKQDAPPTVTLEFDNVAADMVQLVRSVTTPATVDIAVVLASDPDVIEEQYTGLIAIRAPYDESRISFEIARQDIAPRPWPAHRMTAARFPGQFR